TASNIVESSRPGTMRMGSKLNLDHFDMVKMGSYAASMLTKLESYAQQHMIVPQAPLIHRQDERDAIRRLSRGKWNFKLILPLPPQPDYGQSWQYHPGGGRRVWWNRW